MVGSIATKEPLYHAQEIFPARYFVSFKSRSVVRRRRYRHDHVHSHSPFSQETVVWSCSSYSDCGSEVSTGTCGGTNVLDSRISMFVFRE